MLCSTTSRDAWPGAFGCCRCGWRQQNLAAAEAEHLIDNRRLKQEPLECFAVVPCSFFGLLMVCLEINIGICQDKMRRNFGCLFTFAGRAIFIFLWVAMWSQRALVVAAPIPGMFMMTMYSSAAERDKAVARPICLHNCAVDAPSPRP